MVHQVALIACHDCDLLHRLGSVPQKGSVKCSRCGAVLIKHDRNTMEHTLALACAGLILFVLANVFPLLSLEFEGQVIESALFTGVQDLYFQDSWLLAGLVLLTTIIVPLTELVTSLYILLPLKYGRVSWQSARLFRLLHILYPWSMMEVFMLGILVSMVKLGHIATIIPGIALWSFGALIFVLAAINATMDPEAIWTKITPVK